MEKTIICLQKIKIDFYVLRSISYLELHIQWDLKRDQFIKTNF